MASRLEWAGRIRALSRENAAMQARGFGGAGGLSDGFRNSARRHKCT